MTKTHMYCLVFVIIAYCVGARYPMLAQKLGIA